MYDRTRLAALTLISTLLYSNALFSQVGKETDFWKWTQRAKHHNSIVKIVSGKGHGTGVIIFADSKREINELRPGYCLTAAHLVAEAAEQAKAHLKAVSDDAPVNKKTVEAVSKKNRLVTTATFYNGFRTECEIVETDSKHDVAVISLLVPKQVQAAKVSRDAIEVGEALEFSGLGAAEEMQGCLRHFSTTASVSTNESEIFADVLLLPGDSGGPIFNDRHEVVGVISGGWFWMDRGVVSKNGTPVTVTWPARGCNTSGIRGLLLKIRQTRMARR